MYFVSKDLRLILYTESFNSTPIIWVNQNLIGNICTKTPWKCQCGRQVSQFTLILTSQPRILCHGCLGIPHLGKILLRECAHCDKPELITQLKGHCCEECSNYRTSNYIGCISCLSYQQSMNGEIQCINCRLAKRPFQKIFQLASSVALASDLVLYLVQAEWITQTQNLVWRGDGFQMERDFTLGEKLKSFIPNHACQRCGCLINPDEQLKLVPLDQLQFCIRCVYPDHTRCVDCQKFMQEAQGKTRCINCFKKRMRNGPKRECSTCKLMEIPDIPENRHKTQCYSCWRKFSS